MQPHTQVERAALCVCHPPPLQRRSSRVDAVGAPLKVKRPAAASVGLRAARERLHPRSAILSTLPRNLPYGFTCVRTVPGNQAPQPTEAWPEPHENKICLRARLFDFVFRVSVFGFSAYGFLRDACKPKRARPKN